MENCSQKFDFMSQPIETESSIDVNFHETSRKQSFSQPPLKTSNSHLVDFMNEPFTSSSYYGCDEAPNSSIVNEDDRLSEQGSSVSLQRPTDEFVRSCDGKINSDDVDIKVMFDKYKEWGILLERNLISLGDKITLQTNELSQYNRDYEFLLKQKENNKRILVELQIQVENLDISKQRVIKDCETDKKNKSENIGHLFQTLFANDEYIRNTHQKFNEVLQNDKKKFEFLLSEIKLEIENHRKFSETYSQEMHALFEKYENSFNNLCEDELNMDFSIESTIRECQMCKQEKKAKEFEVENSCAVFQNLNDQIYQLNNQIELLQNEYEEYDDEINNILKLSDRLNEILCEERSANEKFSSIYETGKIKYEEKIEYENLVKEVTDENAGCASYFENILKERLNLVSVINEKELNISTLNGEIETSLRCHSLNSELNALSKRGEHLKDKYNDLENEIILKLQDNDKIKTLIKDHESNMIDIVNKIEQEKKLTYELETINNNANQELENSKIKLSSSVLSDKKDVSEKYINELENSLDKHKEKSSELEKNMNDTENDYSNISSEFEVVSNEQHTLDEKEKNILLKKEEQCETLQSLTGLKNDFTDLEENYNKQLNSEETEINLDELREELKRVIEENKHQEDVKTMQLYTTSDSFRFQVQSLNDQMRTLKSEKDEVIKKKISHNARYRRAIPKLEEELKIVKNSVLEIVQSFFDCIDFRMDYINQLLEIYKKASLEMKSSSKKQEVKMLIQSIEKELSNTMKYMNVINDGPKIVEPDNLSKFQQIYRNVQNKYADLVSNFNSTQSKDTLEKLTELTIAIFGGLTFPTKPSSTDTAASSQRTITSDELTTNK